MGKNNAVYAQSGGVTPVINASAYGVITAARESDHIDEIYGGLEGINGVLDENLIDFSKEPQENIDALTHTPAGALGSCRLKLQDLEKNKVEFNRVIEVLEAHDIHTFFYNGGNDSMDTVAKLAQFAQNHSYPLKVIGVPKTIDNDLPITDNCPGFGSVAKYNAISMMEGSMDVESMKRDSTKVFVLETMGRHAGWIAASTGLASRTDRDGPHIILLPEVALDKEKFYAQVENTIAKFGSCSITVSEGVKLPDGKFLAEGAAKDSFGHAQLGGAGQVVQDMLTNDLSLKVHGAVLDYCQRSGRHIASGVDLEQAIACGRHAVAIAADDAHGVMVTIERKSDAPYSWGLGQTSATNIANKEKILPPDYIREDGFHITEAFRKYCLPLIQGETPPPYTNGLPDYRRLERNLLGKKLGSFQKG